MNRRAALILVGGLLVAVLLVRVSTAEPVHVAERWPTVSWNVGSQTLGTVPLVEREVAEVEPGESSGEPFRIPDFVSVIMKVLLVALGVAALVSLWDRRPRLRWRRPRPSEDFEVMADIASLVVADAASQRQLLQVGEPRNAIVACWLRLEEVVVAAGQVRDPAATSEEFTASLLSAFAVDPAAVDRLALLYREARFSSHAIGEDQRRGAIDALEAIHDGLRPVDGALTAS